MEDGRSMKSSADDDAILLEEMQPPKSLVNKSIDNLTHITLTGSNNGAVCGDMMVGEGLLLTNATQVETTTEDETHKNNY